MKVLWKYSKRKKVIKNDNLIYKNEYVFVCMFVPYRRINC